MKIIKTLVLFFISVNVTLAMAGEIKPYSQTQFDALTAAGRPVILAVHADWCPTCRAQKLIMSKLMTKPRYKDVTTLVIDFDDEKPILRHYKVFAQSTLIAFNGKREVSRSIGDTSTAGIEELIDLTVE
jgi:thioredoxin 1